MPYVSRKERVDCKSTAFSFIICMENDENVLDAHLEPTLSV